MIDFTPEAEQHLDDLRRHYLDHERIEALRNLENAMVEAMTHIQRNPSGGLPAPRPYPALARPGRLWIKAGRYWIAYGVIPKLTITAIFYDSANIPDRFS